MEKIWIEKKDNKYVAWITEYFEGIGYTREIAKMADKAKMLTWLYFAGFRTKSPIEIIE